MVTRKAWLQLIGYFVLAFVAGVAITGRGFYTHTVGLDIIGIFMVVLSSVMLIKCAIYQLTVRRHEAVDSTEQAGKQRFISRYTYRQWEMLYYPILALDMIVGIILFAMGQIGQGIYTLVIGGALATVMEFRRHKRKMHEEAIHHPSR